LSTLVKSKPEKEGNIKEKNLENFIEDVGISRFPSQKLEDEEK
jgi:hypothetical protein